MIIEKRKSILRTNVPCLITGSIHNTILVKIASRKIIGRSLVSSRYIQANLAHHSRVIKFFLPVCSSTSIPIQQPFCRTITGSLCQIAKLITIHYINVFGNHLNACIGIHCYTGRSFQTTAFSSDQYNTISSTRTINSSSRSIFQHFNRLNVSGINHIDITIHTVNHIKRTGGTQ